MSRFQPRRTLITIAVAAAMAPMTFAAESESEPQVLSGITVYGETDGYNAPLAASSKTDTPLRDVPQSISVITRESIDDLNMQSIGDVVSYVPGVSMAQGEGNRETPIIRGSSSTGDFFLDGMRDDVQYYRDLYNIEQVEVLKGANGMMFGRGGVTGLINRVTKQANGEEIRSATLQGGSHGNKRASLDIGQSLTDTVAFRLNGVYEDSDSYRDDVLLKRYGVNPTMTIKASEATGFSIGLEYFHDERTADRGVSSFQGRPLKTRAGEFFGNPRLSPTDSTVKSATVLVEHRFSDNVLLRNRTRYADYSKFYQNVFPGAVNSTATSVSLSAYNNDTQRRNLFNQTDLMFSVATGSVQHKLLTGVELARQETQNFRETGYFDSVATGTQSVSVPLSNPRTDLPVSWRQSAGDADNDGTARIAALYLQDEIVLSPHWQILAGLRFDRFEVDLTNNRTSTTISNTDNLLSPRLALVYKPVESMSLYASYGMAYQPRAGEQLASLSATNASLDPEEFTNYELGAKWDALPGLALTAALFRIERDNIAVADPDIGQPGGPPAGTMILIKGQRNQGLELGATGSVTDKWSIIGAFTYQDAEVTQDQSTTVLEGARLGGVPKITASLWNRYDINPQWGVGLGIVGKDNILAATENLQNPANNVRLHGFTRFDAAVYYTFSERVRAQVNVENLTSKDYFQFAHSNTNVTPGSPRAVRATVTAWF